MQIGISNFQARRLDDALRYRMISKSAIAAEIEVQPSSITKYLAGDAKPSPQAFSRLCKVLDFPPQFFLAPPLADPDAPRLWRSLNSAKKIARARGESVLSWQEELRNYFNSFWTLPKYDLPDFCIPTDYKKISFGLIDEITTSIRDFWGVGSRPIGNMVRQLEKSGVVVCAVDLMAEKLDAVSTISNGVPYVLLNTSKQSNARSRFDAAHELGHIVLHRNVSREDYSKERGFDAIEEQAHHFASSLLLPEIPFVNDLWAPTLKCFVGMKEKWKVSIQAMMRRCLGLKIITETQYTYLNINLSKKEWRKSEPFDEETPLEKPRLFSQCVEKLENEIGLSRCQILRDARLPQGILEEMSALPVGYFNSEDSDDDKIVFLTTS